MIKTIAEALEFIEAQRINNTSLETFKKIFEKYDKFQEDIFYIHITGTNGKGSTSKMLHDMLANNEYKVGMFSSPHMIIANDRIRINGTYISDQDIIFYVNFFYQDILDFQLNFFQIYTLIALRYFYDQKVDVALIEVGIGGLLDSTNVIDGKINIITNINYDHTEKLGSTIEAIAYQKAGIIKPHSHVLSAVHQKSAREIIKKEAEVRNANLVFFEPVESNVVDKFRAFSLNDKSYRLHSRAVYQVNNAVLALSAIKIIEEDFDFKIDHSLISKALETFEWIGRFETVRDNPEIILDGAHNIAGIKALIQSDDQKSHVVFSALKDKDYDEMISLLQDHYEELVFVEFDFYRSLKMSDLEDYDFKKYDNLEDALDYLYKMYPLDRIIICGSLYFISEVRTFFKGEFNDSNK